MVMTSLMYRHYQLSLDVPILFYQSEPLQLVMGNTDLFVICKCGGVNEFTPRSELLVLAHTSYFRSYVSLVFHME